MNDKRPVEIDVAHGTNPHTKAGAIGGVNAYIDDDGRPTVILAAAREGAERSTRMKLHEGDTFELGPEEWQVTEIVGPNSDDWAAVLTQLR